VLARCGLSLSPGPVAVDQVRPDLTDLGSQSSYLCLE
jgi:hypothetical protein